MYDTIDVKDINDNYILLDLRTIEEFDNFHIPNSISIPILNYEERKIVGTLYDNGEKDLAKKRALKYGASKLNKLHDLILKNKEKDIVFYCSRGGFRSKTISSLFFSLGYNVHQLKGGIKSYRNTVNHELPELIKDITLTTVYGPTGSGKSDILNIIKNKFPIIDLEKFANHRGSVLGSIGLGKPNSQKMFEAYLYYFLKNTNSKNFLIEGESKRIGNVIIPEKLWEKMQKGNKIYIDSPINYRVERLVKSYTENIDAEELLIAINHIYDRISKENFIQVKNSIESKEYRTAAKILCEKYYDRNYKFKPNENTKVFLNTEDTKCAEDILNYIIKNPSV